MEITEYTSSPSEYIGSPISVLHEERIPIIMAAPHLTLVHPSSPIYNPTTNPCLPPKKRKTVVKQEVFDGSPTWITPLAQKSYEAIINQPPLYEEPMHFDSINCRMVEELLGHNGLVAYLKGIDQDRIYKSELAQFYVNMRYQRQGIPVVTSLVNQSHVMINLGEFSEWTKLPNVGVRIQEYKNLSDLPFPCNKEALWTTLTHHFDPLGPSHMTYADLTAEASMILKVFLQDIDPSINPGNEPSNLLLVAIFCIFQKIKVNWASFVLHNIASGVRHVGGTRHFPRLLSKLFEGAYLNVPLTPISTMACLQPFTAGSFNKKWLNNFSEYQEDPSYLIHQEVLELKQRTLLLEKHILDHERLFTQHQELIHNEHEFNLEINNIIKFLSSKIEAQEKLVEVPLQPSEE